MHSTLLLALAPLFLPTQASRAMPPILPLRERAELRDAWLKERLDTIVTRILHEADVDTWILVAREYNEDPVVKTMLPATWLAARRRTILIFHDPTPLDHKGERLPLERLAIARYDIGEFFPSAWNKEEQPDQWERLSEIVADWEPRRIAVNFDPVFALGDGLSSSQHTELLQALPTELQDAIVTDHRLPIRWLETRIPAEMGVYPSVVRIAHALLAEGLSARAITPGKTTTADLEWWFRGRVAELQLDTWFHPSVSVQRADEDGHSGSFAKKGEPETIRRGDLVHVDFGITYLGLNTDTQQHAYVLRAGEQDAPEGLKRGLAVGNRLQDILMGEFQAGRSGNEILETALARAKDEGIEATIYTHPLGFHGHGAGPTIGLWDQQGGVPGRGDYPLYPDTAHSIELNAVVEIPEWGNQKVRIMLEEDAFFTGRSSCRFLDGRQTELFLIR